MPHKFGTKSGAETRILRTSTSYYTTSEGIRIADTRHSCQDEQQLERDRQGNTQTQVLSGRNGRVN